MEWTFCGLHFQLNIFTLNLHVPQFVPPYKMMDTETEDEKTEYLMIAENVERRGLAETDPIKKARIAQLIKSHWGNRWGGDMENTKIQNGLSEIGDFIGLIFDGYNTNLKT